MLLDSIKAKFSPVLVGWGVVILVLFLPVVNNHTETEDAYMYAQQLVETDDWAQLIHPNHRIYHIIGDEFYSLTKALFGIDALSSLVWLSRICALLTLVFLNLFFRSQGVPPSKALVLLAILSVVYNFWRYSQAAEINAMAWCTQAFCLYLFTKARENLRWVPLLALAGCLATLVHTVNIVPVVAFFGAYYFLSKRLLSLGVFFLTLLVFTGGLFKWSDRYIVKKEVAIAILEQEVKVSKDAIAEPRSRESMRKLDLKSFPKAVVGLGVATVGVNTLMGFDSIYFPLKHSLFKERYLYEERFMAKNISLWHKGGWGLFLVSTVGGALWLILLLIRKAKSCFHLSNFSELKSFGSENLVVFCALITAVTSLVFVLWFEPGNPEMWALLLPMLILPVLLLLVNLELKPLFIFYTLFAATNYAGGMSLLAGPHRDYFHATLEPLLEESREGDVLLKAQNHSGIPRYTNYNYPGIEVGTLSVDEYLPNRVDKIIQMLLNGRRIFVHREVLEREGSFGFDLESKNLNFTLDQQSGGGELFLNL